MLNKIKLGLSALGFLVSSFAYTQDNSYNSNGKGLEGRVAYESINENALINNELLNKNSLNLSKEYNFSQKDLEKYNNWVDKTIKESKQKRNTAIIVDKSEYILYLIDNGKVHSTYPVELGWNPYDDKKQQGDGCTPEGLYKVAWKRDFGQTVFYRAFLLDYPNKEDIKKNKTGNFVEIHGYGTGMAGNNGGHNWTLGCVALSNENMDELFKYVENGDRITVVRYTDKF